MDDGATVSELLDERPELESPLRDVLEVDAGRDAWTFDDAPVDSGVFGELVSRGLVVETDDGDGYRVADPEAVRTALADPDEGRADPDTSIVGSGNAGVSGLYRPSVDTGAVRNRLGGVDGPTVGAVGGALLVVVAARVFAFGSVFRDGTVVLSGNDPYYYRYWVEQALAASDGTFDLSGLATMSDAVQTEEPLLVATLWAVASLVGGDAAGWALAWYPVVAAVVTAVFVCLLTVAVTEDQRVALAAVLLLAVTPAHAFRTSIGFADHHAFDYLWLALTAYALVRLDEIVSTADGAGANAGGATGGERVTGPAWRDPKRWLAAAGLAFAVTGQVLAWDASPLMIAPLGLYVAVRVLDDVRASRSPAAVQLPLVSGLSLAAVLVGLVHTIVGWHSGTVAYAPVLLLVGVAGVVAAGELTYRFDRSARELAGVEVIGAVVGVLGIRALFPAYWADAATGIRLLTEQRNIAEVQSLLSGDTFGWLLLFGFVLVLAVPYLAWASRRAYLSAHEWLVPTVYCWYFLALAVFQVRFAGQLSLFATVFAGLGFVHLAARVDLTAAPVPFVPDAGRRGTVQVPKPNTLGSFAILFLLVGGLSLVQVPVKTGQVTTDGDAYATAAWIDEYADEQGWSYPDNYVFSQWGKNRMYNYFVNGQAESYGFARINFDNFTQSTDGEKWYQRLRNRVGFVVVSDRDAEAGSIHDQLSGAYGGRRGGSPGLSHYRAVYESEGGRTVFTLVPGATLTGISEAETLTTGTDVRLDGQTFTYERAADVRYGIYEVAVPYPGNYSVGGETIRVSEADVRRGRTYELFDGPGIAHWSFDEGNGSVAYDRWGGNHMHLEGTVWTADGMSYRNGSSTAIVENGLFLSVGPNESLTIELTFRGNLSESPGRYPTLFSASGDGRIGLWARTGANDFGVRIDDDDGDDLRLFGIERTEFDSSTTVTVVLDRESDELRLYENGSLAGTRDAGRLNAVTLDGRIGVGTGWDPTSEAAVVVSDLRVYNSSRPPDP